MAQFIRRLTSAQVTISESWEQVWYGALLSRSLLLPVPLPRPFPQFVLSLPLSNK